MAGQDIRCRHCQELFFWTLNEYAEHCLDVHATPDPDPATVGQQGTIGRTGPWPRRLWTDVRTLSVPINGVRR